MARRKRFEAKTKVKILKRHLQKKEAVSSLCEEYDFVPGSLYQWQEILFSRGHICFENKLGRPKDEKKRDEKISHLEKKLEAKNEVISELMEELLKEKKLAGVI